MYSVRVSPLTFRSRRKAVIILALAVAVVAAKFSWERWHDGLIEHAKRVVADHFKREIATQQPTGTEHYLEFTKEHGPATSYSIKRVYMQILGTPLNVEVNTIRGKKRFEETYSVHRDRAYFVQRSDYTPE